MTIEELGVDGSADSQVLSEKDPQIDSVWVMVLVTVDCLAFFLTQIFLVFFPFILRDSLQKHLSFS